MKIKRELLLFGKRDEMTKIYLLPKRKKNI
jgi:hypothetical protein